MGIPGPHNDGRLTMATSASAGVELATSAAKAAEVAARHSGPADRERRLVRDVADVLVEAGFASHFTPKEHRGREGTFSELARALIEVGEACASAAWCGLIFATSSRMASYLPAEGQQDIWVDGPSVPIAAALAPSGATRRSGGGWRLSGRWRFLSGVDFADWALLCAVVTTGDRSETRYFAVPRSDYTVLDTWYSTGMRGTGSNTVELDDAFVPDHRCFPQDTLLRGIDEPGVAACYKTPLCGGHPPLFVAPALGAAQMALANWTEATARGVTSGAVREVKVTAQLTLALSAAQLDAAQLLLERAVKTADFGAIDERLVARNSRDASMIAEYVVGAVDRVFHAGGMQAQVEGNPMQRAWRDVHAAASHVVLDVERNSQRFARWVWDLDASGR